MGWRSTDAEMAEGGFEAGGFKEVRGGDKGEWLGEGRVDEEMGRGGLRWAAVGKEMAMLGIRV